MRAARGAAFAAVLMSVIVLPLSDAVAQGSGCAHDAKIASALDNYRVAWVVSKGRLGAEGERGTLDSPGTYWERVTDEAHYGVDSLRSGAIGDNEHVELTTRIEGPATLRFWWKVDSQEHADFLTFAAVPENEADTADETSGKAPDERRISGVRGWTEIEVSLPLTTHYRVRWSYEKDSSGSAHADAGWIDDVRVDGPGYGEIQMYPPEAEGDSVRLSWPTIPCRHYQAWWRPEGTSLPWQAMFPQVEPATGVEGSLLERSNLHAKREYRVTLIEPPSFTRTPSSQEIAESEEGSLTLVYEAEGTGPLEYTWFFRGADDDQAARLLATGDGREIVSDGERTELSIAEVTEAHEGEYILVAENEAGREPAPAVSVSVFQPPRLKAFVVRAGGEPKRRIAIDDPGAPSPPGLSVNAGAILEIDPEIGGSGSIEAVWERQEAGSGDWLLEVPARLLRIEQAAPEHTGLYRLNLESRWGVWKGPRVVAVNVISPPTNLCVRAESGACLAEGDSLEVDQLERLILSVEAEGTPEFTYQWYRTNDPISQEEGGQSPTLSVATKQAGVSWYQVHVTNSAGFLDTEQFEITVTNAKPNNVRIMLRGTPTVTDRKWFQTRQFDPLQLSVEADGAGPFRYQWYRSSQRVSEELGGNSATVTVATDQIGKHVYHVDVANDIDTATSKTFEIRVSICPDHLFQGLHPVVAPPYTLRRLFLQSCS